MPNAEDHSAEGEPLTDGELDAAFTTVFSFPDDCPPTDARTPHESARPVPGRLLLAVSGGADSLSLMVLCHEWLQRNRLPIQLFVASVDHRLRPEAADECAYVARLAAERGLPHQTLVWEGEKSHSNVQGLAREARYRLLSDHARSIDCGHIAIAHHQDDQAETLIMRLLRGSGVTGLAAMRPVQPFGAVTLLRPLLGFPKARLVASLVARSITWAEDPSNRSPGYLRTRVRSMLPMFAAEGCDSARLAATARRLQRAEDALDGMVQDFYRRFVSAGPGHSLYLPLADLRAQPEEIRLRLLRAMLGFVAGPSYPPREEKLMALDEALCQKPEQGLGSSQETGLPGKRTVGGCCFEAVGGLLWVYRELGRELQTLPLSVDEEVNWLGLYRVRISGDCEAVSSARPVLRPLGAEGRLWLVKEGHGFSAEAFGLPSIPRGALEALPSVWLAGQPVHVKDWTNGEPIEGIVLEFEEKDAKFGSNETIE
ncbi:tRNA lysidine(34) synthetase TilS [Cohaesibacter haloalkalitolerans]|uniref:tRNA lysidine(34) synthetase TilS n=1 Tax=Cohaesibacter haloalkalitolerans TaxID=1162980 RepID=UPI0013C4F60A|nr:tRNA lysidine(34) synthetase TilS [Cohaesibacter haloalkalitolerans]